MTIFTDKNPVPVVVYDENGNAAGSSASAGAKTSAQSQSVTPASDAVFVVRPQSNATSNISGSITAGGVAQTMAPANANRNGYRFQNNSAGDLWINDVGGTASAAPPSFKVSANGYFETPARERPTQAISVFGATTAQAWSAREY